MLGHLECSPASAEDAFPADLYTHRYPNAHFYARVVASYAQPDSDNALTDAYGDVDPNAYAYRVSDSYRDVDAYPDVHAFPTGNGYPYPLSDDDTNGHPASDLHANLNAHAIAHGYLHLDSYRDSFSDGDSHADAHAHTYVDANVAPSVCYNGTISLMGYSQVIQWIRNGFEICFYRCCDGPLLRAERTCWAFG